MTDKYMCRRDGRVFTAPPPDREYRVMLLCPHCQASGQRAFASFPIVEGYTPGWVQALRGYRPIWCEDDACRVAGDDTRERLSQAWTRLGLPGAADKKLAREGYDGGDVTYYHMPSGHVICYSSDGESIAGPVLMCPVCEEWRHADPTRSRTTLCGVCGACMADAVPR